MRRSRLTRQLMATTLPLALIAGAGIAVADPMLGRTMSSYGLPGGIDTPTAETLPDGSLGATVSLSDYARRANIFFQALPGLTTVLRYGRVDGIDDFREEGFISDRSLDLRYQIVDEDGWRPAVAIGLQDFLGTGVYSGEYIVATRNVTPTVRASVGLGWGTLAGKPRVIDVDDLGGTPNVDQWFRGGAKPFASVSWQVNDRLNLTAEYSNDIYLARYSNDRDVQQGDEPSSKLNLGASYRIGRNYEAGIYTIGGKTIGAQFTIALNPRDAAFPSGLEKAPAPVRPRVSPAQDPEGWSGSWSQDPTAQPAIQKALGDAMAKEGQRLESMALTATRAEVRLRNQRYINQAEAVGRTARLMTRALPPSVETFVITSTTDGMATSSVTMRRSDVERLENTEAGQIAAASTLSDAAQTAGLVQTPDLYPRFRWSVRPYVEVSIFDAEDGLTSEFGAEARASYEIMPGLIATGALRQRVFGDIGQRGPGIPGARGTYYDPDFYADTPSLESSPLGVPRVRSDTRMYTGNSNPVIPELTLAWYAKPAEAVYSRVTVGLLERGYGGVSAEALWKPATSPLGFGAEINHVRKRDFDQLFDFRDYEVTTGHLSAYYEFSQGITGQLDVGRYLAGDVGATVTLSREFANGWQVGAFVTKTDLSAEEFGEGSFDKGVKFSIPISWGTGQPSRDRVANSLRSLSRDGGSRVEVDGRLYDRVRESHTVDLYEGWGKFWR
ncbi:YjbH domain-containing protein [Paracoccus hibiscisoli]|uniref:YjbH domain-containing protein n=1 Tax=Paracoccus hibiscisoli TaxID=2023261 RepID=A0A4U0R3I2_9RHOB|nr:YjbH domain-containing protein [Paracoccus hibiscisoli]TJZ82754.1 YjbH domain-containing protein [Paracoccus hibiscisoli]